MKFFNLYVAMVLGMGLTGTVNAASFNSAYFCQVIGSSTQVAYHSAGVLIALRNNVRVSCPINGSFFRDNMNVKVYFNSTGATSTGANLISCQLNKITSDDKTSNGSPRAAGIRVIDRLDLSNSVRLPKMIGANVVCTLQRNAKILGYQLI